MPNDDYPTLHVHDDDASVDASQSGTIYLCNEKTESCTVNNGTDGAVLSNTPIAIGGGSSTSPTKVQATISSTIAKGKTYSLDVSWTNQQGQHKRNNPKIVINVSK